MRKYKFKITFGLTMIFLAVGIIRTALPSENTYEELLKKAMLPVGNTMYVWGGGWSSLDNAAGEEATTIGVSKRWAEFAAICDATYDYETTRYQNHDGLDCSGYIGWLIYNVFEDSSGKKGYVMSSTKMAETFASYGWGSYTPVEKVKNYRPGDIMSMPGHVWLCLGMCKDGSVLLVHASPPGVRVCGTLSQEGKETEAVALATWFMKTYYLQWYTKFPSCGVNYDYLEKSAQFRWYPNILSDKKGISKMSAEEIVMNVLK